jgi:hypothetical protein
MSIPRTGVIESLYRGAQTRQTSPEQMRAHITTRNVNIDLRHTNWRICCMPATRRSRLVAWSWACVLFLLVGIIVPWLLLLALVTLLVAWLGFLPQRVKIEYEVEDSLTRWSVTWPRDGLS